MSYKKPRLFPPWQGWADDNPDIVQPAVSFKTIVNTLINKGRLVNVPWLVPFVRNGANPAFTSFRTFLDGVGNWHTVGFGSTVNPAYLTPPSWTQLTREAVNTNGVLVSLPSGLLNNLPYAIEIYQNKIFFSNTLNKLSYIDGDADWWTILGDTDPIDISAINRTSGTVTVTLSVGLPSYLIGVPITIIITNVVNPDDSFNGTFQGEAGSATSVTYLQNGIDESSTSASGTFQVGDLYVSAAPGACAFLGKLANHLLMVNCNEPAPECVSQGVTPGRFPARVRWSGVGNPLSWDPTQDPTAGFDDLFEIEDVLTGYATLSTTGFAFRTGGIISLTPTGVAGSPFYFEEFSIGAKGIGCYFPYSLAVFGPFCVFVSIDDIYMFSGQSPQAIGGKAKRSIYKDLAAATGPTVGCQFGYLTQGVDYLSYWLLIPQNNNTTTSVWIYHFNTQSWVNVQLPFYCICIEDVAIA